MLESKGLPKSVAVGVCICNIVIYGGLKCKKNEEIRKDNGSEKIS